MQSVHNKRKSTIYVFLVKTFVTWYKFFSENAENGNTKRH